MPSVLFFICLEMRYLSIPLIGVPGGRFPAGERRAASSLRSCRVSAVSLIPLESPPSTPINCGFHYIEKVYFFVFFSMCKFTSTK
jgi:hypothetical protein